ncbi:MAG: prepilin-type N-terminal cleavage/methylation domain-containing protein [Candidatus Delongbacteria bacterium]
MRLHAPQRSDAGVSLVEMLAGVAILGVVVLGMVTLLVVQARQVAQDKVLTDLHFYADAVLDEAAAAAAQASQVLPNGLNEPLTGARFVENLEFRRLAYRNLGRTAETRLLLNRRRNVLILRNNQRLDWCNDFPPAELDPRRGNGRRQRVTVRDLTVGDYPDRQWHMPYVLWQDLVELRLVLELEDRDNGQRLSREYRRVVSLPNAALLRLRTPLWEREREQRDRLRPNAALGPPTNRFNHSSDPSRVRGESA